GPICSPPCCSRSPAPSSPDCSRRRCSRSHGSRFCRWARGGQAGRRRAASFLWHCANAKTAAAVILTDSGIMSQSEGARDTPSGRPRAMKKLREIMREGFLFAVRRDATVAEAARTMTESNVGIVVVLDNDRLVGVFSERDAVRRVINRGLDPLSTLVEDVMTR